MRKIFYHLRPAVNGRSGVRCLSLAAVLGLFVFQAAGASEHGKLQKVLRQYFPDIKLEQLKPAPVKGFYEVSHGTEVYYISKDGAYILSGSIIDLRSRENITEKSRARLRLDILKAVPESNMIVYTPSRTRRTITVFTDVDCPYCAKFHEEVPDLVKAGIRIRYLMFPRNGLNTETYKKSVSVWCAKDRRKAITIAKAGGRLKPGTCSNPVADNFRLAEKMGVRGTPTLIFDNGRMVSGYVPINDLLPMLGLSNPGRR